MMKYTALLASAMMLLSACGSGANEQADETTIAPDKFAGAEILETPAPKPATELVETSAEMQAQTNAEINLVALSAYKDFAEAFKMRNGSYPLTKRSFRSAVGAFEDAEKEFAVDGAPVNLNLPEGAKIAQPGRIVYRSDGTDYKLIAQRTGDCSIVRSLQPELVDPKRSYGPGDCIADGYWTSETDPLSST